MTTVDLTKDSNEKHSVMAGEQTKLQNRVDPWGKFHVTPERGAWMGNRGILHDDQKQIVLHWQNYGWVTCSLECGDTHRDELFAEGNYSELFFLDEATAFAAGHRPCAACRYQRYKDFKAAWVAANVDRVSTDNPPILKVDQALQQDRYIQGGEKKTYDAVLETLPAGTIFELNGSAFLVWSGRFYRWSFSGYTHHKGKQAPTSTVRVLTPESVVRMFAAGFVPQVHVSAYR